jgi:electron transfer flavoprotein alpha subunit
MTSNVLVLAEHDHGTPARVTFELIAFAKRMGSPVVLVAGPGASSAVESLTAHGADVIVIAESDDVAAHPVAPKAELLQAIAAEHSVAAVLIASTLEGKEVAGRLAVRLDSGVITDAIDLNADGTATQSIFGGSTVVSSRVTKGTPVITIRPNSTEAGTEPGAGQRIDREVSLSDVARSARVVDRVESAQSSRPELAEASVVVTGGRGVGSPDGFGIIEELADALGAAVGASRAATDAGWYPHKFQVGQTGTTVSPQLYVANGVSGAIQHRAGMQTSKTIVVVNKDAEAPLFEIADFGVVGDLFTVVPQLTAEVRKRKG